MHRISGKEFSHNLKTKLSSIIAETKVNPHLAIITIGKTKPIESYISQKERFGKEIGGFITHADFSPTEGDIIGRIEQLASQVDVHGLIIQLPVHESHDVFSLVNLIPLEKDVDGMRFENLGALMSGDNTTLTSATVRGIERILIEVAFKEKETFEEWIRGMHAVIVNHSNLIGKPLGALLLNKNATVTIAHQFSKNLKDITNSADILVSATGKPGLIKAGFVKDGAVVIDAGIEFVGGKIKGDVVQNDFAEMAGWITPVPGGVGPLTVACLWENVVRAALIQNEYTNEDIQNLFAG